MHTDITSLWNEYTTWLEGNVPDQYSRLNAGATKADFAAFKKATGYDLPVELQTLYKLNNGGSDSNLILQYGFMPLASVASAIEAMPLYDQKRIPLLEDYGGNFIGVNLKPDAAGGVGQIINFGRDEDHPFVHANNFSEYLRTILRFIKDGKVKVTTEDNGDQYWEATVSMREYLGVPSQELTRASPWHKDFAVKASAFFVFIIALALISGTLSLPRWVFSVLLIITYVVALYLIYLPRMQARRMTTVNMVIFGIGIFLFFPIGTIIGTLLLVRD